MMRAERVESGVVNSVERWLFNCPIWLLSAAVLTAATMLHGYQQSTAMPAVIKLVADPFTQDTTTGAWGYQSALGVWLPWAVGARTGEQIALVHYLVTIVCVVVAAEAMRRWASELAARLFLFAYFCSPQSWAGTAYLGLFDIITVAGLTVAAVAPASVGLAAGLVLGVNHFEQAAFGMVGVALVRCVFRAGPWRPVIAAASGLLVGRAIVHIYLVTSGIDTNGRLDYIRDMGVRRIVDGWADQLLTLEWAVYNVLWVGVVWMAATMHRQDRTRLVALHLFLTLPVLITVDLSRVYRTVTWPIIILLVLYAADWHDKRLVRRAAIALCVAAVFVPRTEIWYGGQLLN